MTAGQNGMADFETTCAAIGKAIGEPRGALATRLAGSADLYQSGGRPPYSSINFITSHDGFTLNDLVSYREKHNLANGEDNRDGDNHNFSENFGVEGPTNKRAIDQLRLRQIKNFFASLLLSQGVPMISAGDEFRRTQNGNNNAYCQDNDISWINWEMVEKNHELVRFCRSLIEFRRNQPTVRRQQFLTGIVDGVNGWADVSWYNQVGTAIDWHSDELPIICLLAAPTKSEEDPQHVGHDVLIMMNPCNEACRFMIPTISKFKTWRLFIDTSRKSPKDIYPDLNGPQLPAHGTHNLPLKSLAVYVAED